MASQSNAIYTHTIKATGTISAHRFTTYAGAQAGAGVNTLGVACFDVASGDDLTVEVIGTAKVEAGAAISAGAAVQTDANGKAITLDAGKTVGRALEAAGADGDIIEVLLIPN